MPTIAQLFGDDPCRFVPHVYQDRIISDPDRKTNGLLWDPGVGKTGTVLTLLHRWRDRMLPALLVAPKRVCFDVWPDEIERWRFPLSHKIITGDAKKRTKAARTKADIHLINPENVGWLQGFLQDWKVVPYRSLIVDESTKFKNPESKRFAAIKPLLPHIPFRMILTGTVIPHGYEDLWSQIFILDRGESLGESYKEYIASYFTENEWGDPIINAGAGQEIEDRIKPLVSRIDARTVIDLPPKNINIIRITQPDECVKRMEQVLLGYMDRESTPEAFDLIDCLDSSEDDDGNQPFAPETIDILNIYAALRCVCSGFQYLPVLDRDGNKVGRVTNKIHTLKMDVVADLLDTIDGGLLVAYNFREERNQLVERFGAPFVDAETTDARASELFREWNAGKLRILGIQPKSVAFGINLQRGGHHMLWMSPPNSLEDVIQTEARIYRQGQTDRVTIHRIISRGTIEEQVISVIDQRDATQQSFLDALSGFVSEFQAKNAPKTYVDFGGAKTTPAAVAAQPVNPVIAGIFDF